MEKEKINKICNIIINIILIIIVTIGMICTIFNLYVKPNKKMNKKAEAYTNNVVPYANEQLTDLKGTSWLFNEELNLTYQQSLTPMTSQFNVNFVSDNTNFNKMNFGYFINSLSNPFGVYYTPSQVNVYTKDGWNKEEYRLITFDNIDAGNDATNQNLINWLKINATQQTNEEFYNINYNLQNVLVIGEKPSQISNLKEINIEFQNFNNYELPQNIMVDGASYNWNYETGILTIYDATGNVTITIRAEYISGNYSFIELIDSVVLIPLNTFFNLFNFDIFGVNIYALLTATLTLFVIVKVLLKVFK